MKKLSLLLFAICMSVMAWADINPYAYGLSSSLSPDKQTLTFTYYLNADAHNDGPGGKTDGVQIYLVDNATGERIDHPAITNGGIQKGRNTASCSTENIPKNIELSWEVVVHGNSPASPTLARTLPKYQPVSTHGVAVDNDKDSPNFGKIFVTESSASAPSGYTWLDATHRLSLVEYDPATMYESSAAIPTAHQKQYKAFESTSNFSNPDPHRVRISEDGRIFVTSYSTGGDVAVWEYKGNGRYDRLITKKTNQRVVAMDVKGGHTGLKILLCEIVANNGKYNGCSYAQLICREYEIKVTSNARTLESGAVKFYYNDYRTEDLNSWGMIYQNSTWTANNRQHDLINVAYGKGNDIWLKMDFESGQINYWRVVCFDGTNDGSSSYDYGNVSINGIVGTNITSGASESTFSSPRGGEGLIVCGDTLITAVRGYLNVYTVGSDRKLTYKSQTAETLNSYKMLLNRACDFAIDKANNLYVVSNIACNISAVALPYTSPVITRAPKNDTHILADPVPNIYASNLRYSIDEKAPQYEFSFNANTKPKYAEIRFYKSYEGMKESLANVNADDFQGNSTDRLDDENLICYYPINSDLKQGKNVVKLGMTGGVIENKLLTNDCLPPGELYWSVYVETDRSSVFAPIYRQPMEHARYHVHAAVNTYPETDDFGTLYGVQEDQRDATVNKNSSLMVYAINDNNSNNANADLHNINNTTRYSKIQEYYYPKDYSAYNAKPRRLAIAPDGTLYIAHEGKNNEQPRNLVSIYKNGGVYTWDPKNPKDEKGCARLSLFSTNEINTSSGVAIYGHVENNDTIWKVYAANTYNEYANHDDGSSYTIENQTDNSKPQDLSKHDKFGWNGFLEFQKTSNNAWNTWTTPNINRAYSLGRGDASGNVSLVAMEKGIWMCQHREHSVAVKVAVGETYADNLGAFVLSFIPYNSNERRWKSCTNDGGRVKIKGVITYDDTKDPSLNSQKDDSPIQSAPGGGMAAKKINGDDYLYVVNHDGNIVQIKLEWRGDEPRVYTHYHGDANNIKILKTPEETKGVLTVSQNNKTTDWKTAAISSMCFDYAGNLVTTTGVRYMKVGETLKTPDAFGTPEGGQNIIVYTMPYDRTNAREIQAPKSCIHIPERLAYNDEKINTETTIGRKPTLVDLYRPMPNTSYSTICLPFDLNLENLADGHPYKLADVRAFESAEVSEVGGEKMLFLNFSETPTTSLVANTPYIIKPSVRVPGIVELPATTWGEYTANTTTQPKYFDDNSNSITFTGVIPKQDIVVEPGKTLILLAENRLAEMEPDAGKTIDSKPAGEILGFRGYFTLGAPLPQGVQAIIRNKDNTLTGLVDVNGQKINIQKYLREGRIFIRVNDTLYTIDGQKVL